MKLQLQTMTVSELHQIIDEANKLLQSRHQVELHALKQRMRSVLDSTNTIETKVRKIPVKYVNPTNFNEQWSGRGITPYWVRDYLAKGLTLNDLVIMDTNSEDT